MIEGATELMEFNIIIGDHDFDTESMAFLLQMMEKFEQLSEVAEIGL